MVRGHVQHDQERTNSTLYPDPTSFVGPGWLPGAIYVYKVSYSILIWSWILCRESVRGERKAKVALSWEVLIGITPDVYDIVFSSIMLRGVHSVDDCVLVQFCGRSRCSANL